MLSLYTKICYMLRNNVGTLYQKKYQHHHPGAGSLKVKTVAILGFNCLRYLALCRVSPAISQPEANFFMPTISLLSSQVLFLSD